MVSPLARCLSTPCVLEQRSSIAAIDNKDKSARSESGILSLATNAAPSEPIAVPARRYTGAAALAAANRSLPERVRVSSQAASKTDRAKALLRKMSKRWEKITTPNESPSSHSAQSPAEDFCFQSNWVNVYGGDPETPFSEYDSASDNRSQASN